jgi:hypothetical protein
MKINGFIAFLLLFLFVVVVASFYEPLRYLKYTLPLVSLLVYLTRSNFVLDRGIYRYYSTFLFFYLTIIAYLLIQNILTGTLSDRFIPNAVFIISPLLFIILIIPYYNQEKTHQYVKAILIINVIVFCFEEGNDLMKVLTDLDVLKSALFSSDIPTENQLAFVFGFLVLYFLMEKKHKLFLLISLILFILCFKRVVIGAVIACVLTYYFLSLFRIDVSKHQKFWTFCGVVFNLLYIKLTQIMVSGAFDKKVEEQTGFSTDQFFMGRKTFYTAAFEEAGPINWFGLGLGQIDDIIFKSYGLKMNLHSEILKNYFEFGAILFLIWLILFFYKNLFSNRAALLLLYLNILMLTDNVFIYFEVMFYFYFFVLIALTKTISKNRAVELDKSYKV